jgi:hypothetical protein
MTLLGAILAGIAALCLAAVGLRWVLWSFEVVRETGA